MVMKIYYVLGSNYFWLVEGSYIIPLNYNILLWLFSLFDLLIYIQVWTKSINIFDLLNY